MKGKFIRKGIKVAGPSLMAVAIAVGGHSWKGTYNAVRSAGTLLFSAGNTVSTADSAYTKFSAETYPDYVRILSSKDRKALDILKRNTVKSGMRFTAEKGTGRTGAASGVITYSMMKKGTERERDDMASIRPSGWHANRIVTVTNPDGRRYRGYFYNRSHLIAKSLGGCDRLKNMITGTRMQNVGMNDGNGGMAYAETRTRDYLNAHRRHKVYYTAVPVYSGNESLARSVLVRSHSDDGSLDIKIEVYNAAAGWHIDYRTGRYWKK
jgi:DNA-entry nuclease